MLRFPWAHFSKSTKWENLPQKHWPNLKWTPKFIKNTVVDKQSHWIYGSHLKQGTIGQLSEVFNKCCDKLIIFEPFMWLEQTCGTIFILTVCLPLVQRWLTNVNKLLLLFWKCVLRGRNAVKNWNLQMEWISGTIKFVYSALGKTFIFSKSFA